MVLEKPGALINQNWYKLQDYELWVMGYRVMS